MVLQCFTVWLLCELHVYMFKFLPWTVHSAKDSDHRSWGSKHPDIYDELGTGRSYVCRLGDGNPSHPNWGQSIFLGQKKCVISASWEWHCPRVRHLDPGSQSTSTLNIPKKNAVRKRKHIDCSNFHVRGIIQIYSHNITKWYKMVHLSLANATTPWKPIVRCLRRTPGCTHSGLSRPHMLNHPDS